MLIAVVLVIMIAIASVAATWWKSKPRESVLPVRSLKRHRRPVSRFAHLGFGLSRVGPVVETEAVVGTPKVVDGWTTDDVGASPMPVTHDENHDYFAVKDVLGSHSIEVRRRGDEGVDGFVVPGATDTRRGAALTPEGVVSIEGKLLQGGSFTAMDYRNGTLATSADPECLDVRISEDGEVAESFPDRIVVKSNMREFGPGLMCWHGERLCIADEAKLQIFDKDGTVFASIELERAPMRIESNGRTVYAVYGSPTVFDTSDGFLDSYELV